MRGKIWVSVREASDCQRLESEGTDSEECMVMKAKRIRNDLVGTAGVHYVAFELSRRGVVALPTIRNTPGYDIIAIGRSGKKHANLQIKTAQKRPTFWPMPTWKKIHRGKHDYYVLVRGLVDKRPVECFMVTGKEAGAAVKRIESFQSKSGQKRFPCIYVTGKHPKAGAEQRWKKTWDNWML